MQKGINKTYLQVYVGEVDETGKVDKVIKMLEKRDQEKDVGFISRGRILKGK